MSWQDYTYEDIEESAPGSGCWTELMEIPAGGKFMFIVKRTDGASNGDEWRVAFEPSIEDTPDYADDPAMRTFRLTDLQTKKPFLIAGPFAGRIGVYNDDIGDFDDTVAARVGWKWDGVAI